MRLISKEQQIVEKRHAYTLPGARPPADAKDLVDPVLLIRTGDVRHAQVAEAVSSNTCPAPASRCRLFERNHPNRIESRTASHLHSVGGNLLSP